MDVQQLVTSLYKEQFGKLVASLLYASKEIDPGLAEDIVQDAFSAALSDWRNNGIPYNPKGWLYKVCRNMALNRIERDTRMQGISGETAALSVELKFSEAVLDDLQLRLLFACAHPDLSPKIQIAITLKYVANLKVEAIAKALGMTIDGIDKLLVRARQKIKNEKILLNEPTKEEMIRRLPVVHKVIYLIFNEGYRSSVGKDLIREDLCEEALIICKGLIDSVLAVSDSKALYALMLFNAARFKSRFAASGELLDLEKQDRSLWNHELIMLASEYLQRSETPDVSSYHLEASIAYFHCTSPTFAATPWHKITALYKRLLQLNPNPFIELSYAIALYYAGQPKQAFDMLLGLRQHGFLNNSYTLNATVGKLYYLDGDKSKAQYFLSRALETANFETEKMYIKKLLTDLET